jgi:hypothetical protein
VEERGLVSGVACFSSRRREQAASDTGLGRREVWLVEERGLVSGVACFSSRRREQAASDTGLGSAMACFSSRGHTGATASCLTQV